MVFGVPSNAVRISDLLLDKDLVEHVLEYATGLLEAGQSEVLNGVPEHLDLSVHEAALDHVLRVRQLTLILQLATGLIDLGCLVETHAPLVQLQTDLPEVVSALGHLSVLDLFPLHESGSGWTHVDAGLSGRLTHRTVAAWSPECRFDLSRVVVKLEVIFEAGHRFYNGIPLDVG